MKRLFSFLTQNRNIRPLDIALFFRQFSALISAGIPIIKTFEILEKSQINKKFRLLIYSIKREILSGKDLFSGLQPHHQYFDEMTCSLIKLGEHTGTLETVLAIIAENKEKHLLLKQRVKQALIYPTLVMITAFLVTLSMLYFIIPQFAILFVDTKIQLPALTRWIFYCSALLQQHIFIIFLPLAFLPFIFLPAKLLHKPKRHLTQILLKLPLISSFTLKVTLANFARNLAMTFSAGMPITESLTLMIHAGQPLVFTQLMMRLRHHIASGLQLHQAMAILPGFPDLMIQMVKIGEESGMLDQLLNKAARFFEADIEHTLSQLHQLLEPLIMLVLGVLIGGLVIGMYLPIFKLGSAL